MLPAGRRSKAGALGAEPGFVHRPQGAQRPSIGRQRLTNGPQRLSGARAAGLGLGTRGHGGPEAAAARPEDREPAGARRSLPGAAAQVSGDSQAAGPAWGRGGLEGGGAGLGPRDEGDVPSLPSLGCAAPTPAWLGSRQVTWQWGALRARLPPARQGFQMSPGQSSGRLGPKAPTAAPGGKGAWPGPCPPQSCRTSWPSAQWGLSPRRGLLGPGRVSTA